MKPTGNRQNQQESSRRLKTSKKKRLSFLLAFGIFFIFWLVFSGKFDLFHITLGLISCLGVALICHPLIFPSGVDSRIFGLWFRFCGYIPWLFKQIFMANIHVLYLTFHPRMMDLIDPKIITFKTKLTSDVSRTTFANSITLTPGTITIHSGVLGKFVVHCIDDPSGKALPGEMEKKLEQVFQENG